MDKEENTKGKSAAALREELILDFWRQNNVFEESMNRTENPKGEFVFYEGPPTANGKPGIHHLEARAFKDAIPRYKTMQGFHVRRKGGWDTHGLPVELQVEKALGLKSKKEIESYGVAEFNKKCKESVWEYREIWEKFTDRIGYWVDQKNPYVTYHNDYIESVWNVLAKVHDKNLLYKDYKVVPWCPRCGTALSSHELAQGYEDVKDLSVYVKFKLIGFENGYFLAWTTTPWTLPGNVGLAVGADVIYVEAKVGNEILVLAKERLSIITEPYEIIAEHKGSEMAGMAYESLYPFIKDKNVPGIENAWKVYVADFVTTTDGTGIVHTAVMYGQEDFDLGTKVGLPKYHLVNEDGTFKDEAGFLAGKEVGSEDTAVEVIKDLAHRGLLFKKEKYEHSYPFCWRCKTRLIYFARDSWYIRMSSLREKLVKENQEINWEPAHTRDGRFGQWLTEVKDWAISRERYWGTPMPIWADKEGNIKVVGSIDDLKKYSKKSGNKYFLIRHGQGENNTATIHHKDPEHTAQLTEKGRQQVTESAKNFHEKIDVVISSPFTRTKETAKIVCDEIGFPFEKVIYDPRIQEWDTSTRFEGKPKSEFKQYYGHDYHKNPFEELPGGETFAQVIKRVGDFLYDVEKTYQGKNILFVGHDGAGRAMRFIVKQLTFAQLQADEGVLPGFDNAEIFPFDFVPLPHNENYELDLHKPFIDDVKLVDENGQEMTRVKEVMDVWFDSGAMPFAQDHYPFENKEWVEGAGYPADFISEAIDQTRGWFYTLHAVGTLMGRGKAFKNVICLGHILDAKGKKMSKSQGNIVDPWEMIEKYGVDTLRMWMYSVNQPGDSKNFDEKTVYELHNKVFNLLYNILAFYELYRDRDLETQNTEVVTSVLDKWILTRLAQLTEIMTTNLDKYKLLEPVRAMREFIDDLSTWYVRRSRESLKEGNINSKQILYLVLKSLAKLMAPFAPFTAEDIWQKLKNENDKESVHLEFWPKPDNVIYGNILSEMQTVREIVTKGLELRQKAGMKIRQPLASFSFEATGLEQYYEIIKDELNVKEIKTGELALDTNITPELKLEGDYRELVRAIQDMRKDMDLTPKDLIAVSFSSEMAEIVMPFMDEFKKTVQADKVEFNLATGAKPQIKNLR